MDSDPPEKFCIACGHAIPVRAKKCSHCSSFQDWRRVFDFGQTAFALLIALFSIIGMTFTAMESINSPRFLGSHDPEYLSYVQDISIEHIRLLYTNTGRSRVIVEQGALCRVPVATAESGFNVARYLTGESSGYRANDLHPTEIEWSHMLSYDSDEPPRMVDTNQSVVLEFPIADRRPENGRPFNEEALAIPGYCFVQARSITGEDAHQFIELSTSDVLFLQKPLRDNPEFSRKEG